MVVSEPIDAPNDICPSCLEHYEPDEFENCGHCSRSLCHYCVTHHAQIVFEKCSRIEDKIFGKIRDFKRQKLSLEVSYEDTLTKITELELTLRSMVENRIATLTENCSLTKLVKCAQYRCQLELLKDIYSKLSKARTLLVFDKEFVQHANQALKEAENILREDSRWCQDYAIDLEVELSNISRLNSEFVLTGKVFTLPRKEEPLPWKSRDRLEQCMIKKDVSTQTDKHSIFASCRRQLMPATLLLGYCALVYVVMVVL